VPVLVFFEELLDFLTNVIDVGGEVELDVDGAEDTSFVLGPVVIRLRGEVRRRQDDSGFVPAPHAYAGEADVLNTPPLAFQHHDVVDAQRVGERELKPREYLTEGSLGGDAENDAGHSGGGDEVPADGADRSEDGQCEERREQDDDDCQKPADDLGQGPITSGA